MKRNEQANRILTLKLNNCLWQEKWKHSFSAVKIRRHERWNVLRVQRILWMRNERLFALESEINPSYFEYPRADIYLRQPLFYSKFITKIFYSKILLKNTASLRSITAKNGKMKTRQNPLTRVRGILWCCWRPERLFVRWCRWEPGSAFYRFCAIFMFLTPTPSTHTPRRQFQLLINPRWVHSNVHLPISKLNVIRNITGESIRGSDRLIVSSCFVANLKVSWTSIPFLVFVL